MKFTKVFFFFWTAFICTEIIEEKTSTQKQMTKHLKIKRGLGEKLSFPKIILSISIEVKHVGFLKGHMAFTKCLKPVEFL